MSWSFSLTLLGGDHPGRADFWLRPGDMPREGAAAAIALLLAVGRESIYIVMAVVVRIVFLFARSEGERRGCDG